MLSILSTIANVSLFVSQMPKGQPAHPHCTRQVMKTKDSKAQSSSGATIEAGWGVDGDASSGAPKRPRMDTSSSSIAPEALNELLGDAPYADIDIQEAFGSLLNAQDILGVSCDPVADNEDGEQASRRALKKLYRATQSSSGFLAAATVPPDSYSHPTQAFALGAAVESRLKLRIIKGLFVPFKVLYVSNWGQPIHHYSLHESSFPGTG